MPRESRIFTLDSIGQKCGETSEDEAKKRGAESGPNQAVELFKAAGKSVDEEKKPMLYQKPKSSAFKGRGFRLGGFHSPLVVVPPEEVIVLIKIWEDGFSLDDGPLRPFDDPANAAFMEDLKNGFVPDEVAKTHKGSRIDVHVERTKRKFRDPKRCVTFVVAGDDAKIRIAPFSGRGLVLGDPIPPPKPESKAEKKPESNLNSSAIQVHFPDGRRVVGSFKPEDRVDDLRGFICRNLSTESTKFRMFTMFPPRFLDEDASLASEKAFKATVYVGFCKHGG